MSERLRHLALAVLLGLLAATAAVGITHAAARTVDPDPLPIGDRVQQAADAFRDGDHVYVAADAHDRVPPADEARLEQLADASDTALYIAVWEAGESGYYLYSDAADQLQRTVGEDGVYVIWQGPGDGIVSERGGSMDPDPPADFNGDPVRRLTEIATAVGDGRLLTYSGPDYWGGPGGALGAGLIFGGLALPCALLVIGLGRTLSGRGFRLQGGWW
ncbi:MULTISPECIES: hypothetical protein [unclassified Nocardioides]|uniref:hypothetical protein n=1 Tax=unclassified Nocardioides TaxID=2615069 RepID=UPI0009EFAA37|nr:MULTISPECIES: hypothetical protein [unclassified Nocardioides]GAW50797.1 hypothetical protein PD653B2_3133 [Nocardioides sp. PD653-B2]GAW52736.1 hypothetical protein PD653_0129 [Nocardioides sp. PD653]